MTTLILKIPRDLKEMLDKCARNSDLSTAQVVRSLIRDYVKENYKDDSQEIAFVKNKKDFENQ